MCQIPLLTFYLFLGVYFKLKPFQETIALPIIKAKSIITSLKTPAVLDIAALVNTRRNRVYPESDEVRLLRTSETDAISSGHSE